MLGKRFLFYCFILSFFFLIISSAPKSQALDIENERPVPLWGLPSAEWVEVTQPGELKRSYGEPESTITIRNTAPGTIPDMQFFADCAINSGATLSNCFYFVTNSSTKLLNSKTYVNNRMQSAVAIMRYAGVNVVGDSYSASGNFNFWGRHLRQTTDGTDSNAIWQVAGYNFNPSAQAYWDPSDANKNREMTEAINRLAKNAKSPVSSQIFIDASLYYWNAHLFDGVCGLNVNCNEKSMYPEGRVWRPDQSKNLYISSSIRYTGRGTILLPGGNLLITDRSIDQKYGNPDAALGFIVQNGNVTITNTSDETLNVRASMFVPNGTITLVGNKINLIGSFVAKDFQIDSKVASFIQDTRGESSWPPGFRELKLPEVNSN